MYRSMYSRSIQLFWIRMFAMARARAPSVPPLGRRWMSASFSTAGVILGSTMMNFTPLALASSAFFPLRYREW